MTQEGKQLLFKDLCARLPYHPTLNWKFIDNTSKDEELKELSDLCIWWITKAQDCEVKPYLRSMSSMTEEEEKEYRKTQITKWIKSVDCTYRGYYDHRDTLKTFDWLNANHFDYRGLIEKGLAIEVTEDNNPYKSHE